MDLRVTDLKQWFYCPRVVYWNYCLPVQKKPTYKMEHGRETHELLAALETRRSLKRYGLQNARRQFHVPLQSEELGLSGLLDLLLISEQKNYFPVEFKYTTGNIAMNHLYQLAGYALLIEETYGVQVETGFLYRVPLNRVSTVRLSPRLKEQALDALRAMQEMIYAERMPPPTPQRAKCIDCEFRRYCNDVW